jgi:DNA primase
LTPQWLDQLRSRVALSGVIGRTTRLTKAGREFKACCPFHSEKTPSFTVNDEKGFYHCFGCGAHGDAIRWLTDQRGLDFIDAVKELAGEAGMELPAPDPRAAAVAGRQQSLGDVLAAAQAWFVSNLRGAEGSGARRYIESRGFPAATLERFGFGLAPGGRQALREALRQFPEELLIEAGLRIVVEGKEPYDRFRGRLMLPIRNSRGGIVGFGGRILDASATDAPKYLNSPDTPLFDKGRTLYNLDQAAPLARKSGRLIVVEGYMDVVALAAAGIEEAVAPLGTALTEAQLELLWRVCAIPVLCFDGDTAGQRAAARAMHRALPLLRPGHSMRVARLPAGLDPDDLVRQNGAPAMTGLIEQAAPLVDALWAAERDAEPLATPESKAGLKARLLDHTATIQHPDIRALYRRELLARFSAFAFPQGPVVLRRGTARTAPLPRLSANSAERLSVRAHDQLLAAVIAGLIRFPGEIARHAESLARLNPRNPRLAGWVDLLVELGDSGTWVEPDELLPIFAKRGVEPPQPSDYAHLPYAFLADRVDREAGVRKLDEAIRLVTEGPAIASALDEANQRFALDPEGAIAEQARLRNRKLASRRDMMQRATAQAVGEHEHGEAERANEPHGGHRKD